MPDTRGELQQKTAETQKAPAETPAARKPTVLQRCFPYAASLCIMAAMGYLTVYMDGAVMAGRLTGMPYLLITALFAAILAAYHFINRED